MFGHIGPNEQKGVISHDITFFEVASLQNGLSVNEKTDEFVNFSEIFFLGTCQSGLEGLKTPSSPCANWCAVI